jgi:hypothetical protein
MNRTGDQERMQRIRRGLTGLAVVFLFVLLASAISRSGQDTPSSQTQNEGVSSAEPNEPLAEIGAAPGTAAAENDVAEREPSRDSPTR